MSPPDPNRLDAVLLDIEGTTTPIAFVHDVLFPYAAEHVADFLGRNLNDAEVQKDIALLRQLADEEADNKTPGAVRIPDAARTSDDAVREATLAVVRWLMSEDRKATGLKNLQGRIWQDGYDRGELKGQMYDDVRPAMARWKQQGKTVAIYSSGSIAAQKLIFGHSDAGDLTTLIDDYFDTTTGPKKEADSYRLIADRLGVDPGRLLFLTDNLAEADAAEAAGLQVAMLERPGNPEQGPHDHVVLQDFSGI